MASSWRPTLLINTESFQTIDDSSTTADIEFRFGDSVNEKIYWDRTPGRFRASDDLYIDGDLTASGTFSVEGAATFGSAIKINGVTYTFPQSDGSATGKVLKTSAAGVLSWSSDNTGSDGLSYTEGSSWYVNDTGDTSTGALNIAITSGTPATVGLESPNTISGSNIHASDGLSSSGGKVIVEGTEATDAQISLQSDQSDDAADKWDIVGQAADNDLSFENNDTEVAKFTTAGAFQTDSNVTIGSAAAATDYTLTYDGETSDGNLKFFEDESQFQFDSQLQVRGQVSASGKVIADAGVRMNADLGANDAVITFGSDGTNESLTFFNAADRFEFSDDLSLTGGLYSSGGLIIEDGQIFTIEGITYTFPQSDGSATGKVLKTSGAGILSWSTDNAGSGLEFAEGSSYFVNDTGDTMTGALTVAGLTVTAGNTVGLNGVTYTYPPSDGSASGKVLKTSGAGVLSWSKDNRFVSATGATMDIWQTFGYNCGVATSYLGFHGGAGMASTTETNVYTTLKLASDITVTGLRCTEITDVASCTWGARVRKNAANASGTPNCATGSTGGSCGSSTGTVVFTNGDEISIELKDVGANCTDAMFCECAVTFTW